jgi:hypothetical protein
MKHPSKYEVLMKVLYSLLITGLVIWPVSWAFANDNHIEEVIEESKEVCIDNGAGTIDDPFLHFDNWALVTACPLNRPGCIEAKIYAGLFVDQCFAVRATLDAEYAKEYKANYEDSEKARFNQQKIYTQAMSDLRDLNIQWQTSYDVLDRNYKDLDTRYTQSRRLIPLWLGLGFALGLGLAIGVTALAIDALSIKLDVSVSQQGLIDQEQSVFHVRY